MEGYAQAHPKGASFQTSRYVIVVIKHKIKQNGKAKKISYADSSRHESRGNPELPNRAVVDNPRAGGAAQSAIEEDRPQMDNKNERPKCRSKEDSLSLSNAEWMVADCICRGMSEKEAAEELCRSPLTVHTQKKSIYKKIGVSKDTELLWYVICDYLGIVFDLLLIRKIGKRILLR